MRELKAIYVVTVENLKVNGRDYDPGPFIHEDRGTAITTYDTAVERANPEATVRLQEFTLNRTLETNKGTGNGISMPVDSMPGVMHGIDGKGPIDLL